MPDLERPLRVLLIEGHGGLRGDLARALERSGFEVEAGARVAGGARAPSGRRFVARIVDPDSEGARAFLVGRRDFARTVLITGAPWEARRLRDELAEPAVILQKPFAWPALEEAVLAGLAPEHRTSGRLGDPLLATREPALGATLERARGLARRPVSVCIEGELGTGRRALARAIHDWSLRADAPLVGLDRAALETREPGLAMGDVIARAIARARHGSLLLLEPADLPGDGQSQLIEGLRRLPESEAPRLLSLCRESLDESARAGRLPTELQYRLDAARLRLPALRERPADQAELCRSIARRVARELGLPTPEIDDSFVERLAREGFRGNRLGLESRLRSALLRGPVEGRLDADHLDESVSRTSPPASSVAWLDLRTLERDAIVRALAHWDGNRTRASESLGISVRTLRNKIREYGLR